MSSVANSWQVNFRKNFLSQMRQTVPITHSFCSFKIDISFICLKVYLEQAKARFLCAHFSQALCPQNWLYRWKKLDVPKQLFVLRDFFIAGDALVIRRVYLLSWTFKWKDCVIYIEKLSLVAKIDLVLILFIHVSHQITFESFLLIRNLRVKTHSALVHLLVS